MHGVSFSPLLAPRPASTSPRGVLGCLWCRAGMPSLGLALRYRVRLASSPKQVLTQRARGVATPPSALGPRRSVCVAQFISLMQVAQFISLMPVTVPIDYVVVGIGFTM